MRIKTASICFLLLTIFPVSSCLKDPLENYRSEFTGTWDFITIRENMTVIPPEIIDTIVYTGRIEAIYSNREDLIFIRYTASNGMDAVLSPDGYISLPEYRIANGVETLEGLFNPGRSTVSFVYRISSGEYSMNHRVEGSRNKD